MGIKKFEKKPIIPKKGGVVTQVRGDLYTKRLYLKSLLDQGFLCHQVDR